MSWFLFVIVFFPQLLFATAFLYNRGHGAIIFDGLTYKTHHFFNRHGKRCDSYNDYEQNGGYLKIEYGLTSKATVTAESSYQTICESLNGKSQGFDDTILSIRHFITRKGAYFASGEGKLIIPSGGRKYEVRYGRWGGELSLLLSKTLSIQKGLWWWDTKLGYCFFNGYPSDQIRAQAGLGACLNSRLTFYGKALLYYGLWNGQKECDNIIRYNANFRLLTVKIEAFIRIWRTFYLSIGTFQNVWGRNVGTGGSYFAGGRIIF